MARDFQFISDNQAEIDQVNKLMCLPVRATKGSAGYDICSTIDFTLEPGEEVKFPTGLKVYMLPDEFLSVHPRSGQGFKYYVRLANTTGIIDSDYYNNDDNEGHIWVKLRNESKDKIMEVKRGQAVCQGIFQKYLTVDREQSGGEATAERKGGFGSTGI